MIGRCVGRVMRATKDPEARPGRAVCGMGRGYKLHAPPRRAAHVFHCYEVHSLPTAEQVVADVNYDRMHLHRIAHETGRRLYTSLRENRVGRRRQPPRLRLLRLAATKVAQRLLRWRDEIERAFAASSNVGIGLKGVPN